MFQTSTAKSTYPLLAASALVAMLTVLPSAYAQTGATDTAKEEKAVAEEKEENIRTGTIASTGSYGHGDQTIDSGSTGAAPGDEPSVISAGVGRLSGDDCEVTLKNSSEENTYSISYRVIERNQSGRKVNSKYYSDSLKPQETATREVKCNKGSRMEVELRSARKR